MKINRSLRDRTLEYMFLDIQARFGIATKEDIDAYLVLLSEAYSHPEDIAAFLAKKRTCLADLALAGQPIAPAMAIDKVMACFTVPDMSPCFTKFVLDYPVVATRTVPLLSAAIAAYVTSVVPLLATKAALQMNSASDFQVIIDSLRADISNLQAANAVNQLHRPQSIFVSDGPTAKFCWTHGPCYHLGIKCGHNTTPQSKAATWTSQSGSKWREWWKKKGFSLARGVGADEPPTIYSVSNKIIKHKNLI